MSVITGVHGVSLQRLKREAMTAAWLRHLRDGLQMADHSAPSAPPLSLVFFDDLVMPTATVADAARAKGRDLIGSVEAMDADELADFADAAADLLSPEELAQAATLAAKAYTRVPVSVAALLAALDRRFGSAGVVLLLWEFKQVRRYLKDAAIKAAVDRRVREGVTGDCRVLLGHSLGSVVAFEYVRQQPGHHLELLLTVGSPLGLRMVRDRLAEVQYGSDAAWGIPVNVGHWVNVRDIHDPVACAGDLHRWWPGVVDRHVNNGSDAHAAERYLAQRYVGQVVLPVIAPPG